MSSGSPGEPGILAMSISGIGHPTIFPSHKPFAIFYTSTLLQCCTNVRHGHFQVWIEKKILLMDSIPTIWEEIRACHNQPTHRQTRHKIIECKKCLDDNSVYVRAARAVRAVRCPLSEQSVHCPSNPLSELSHNVKDASLFSN